MELHHKFRASVSGCQTAHRPAVSIHEGDARRRHLNNNHKAGSIRWRARKTFTTLLSGLRRPQYHSVRVGDTEWKVYRRCMAQTDSARIRSMATYQRVQLCQFAHAPGQDARRHDHRPTMIVPIIMSPVSFNKLRMEVEHSNPLTPANEILPQG